MLRTSPIFVVVEDEPTINELICDVLTDQGYTALECSGEDEALSLITTYHPDLVITDLLLDEGQTGVSLLKQLRAQPHTKHIPAIMYSCATGRLHVLREELQVLHCAIVTKRSIYTI